MVSWVKRVDASGDCWLWTGSIDHLGYGKGYFRGRWQVAHRGVWESLVGPIPDDREMDHLCRIRNCVNPDHLDVVTHAENMRRSYDTQAARARRKTECKHGHPLSGVNLYIRPNGNRACKECRRWASRKRDAKHRRSIVAT